MSKLGKAIASITLITVTLGVSGQAAYAQKAGQSISIQYGVVKSGRPVDLKSNAVPAGAVVGGTVGLLSAKGKSSSKKARNSLLGAAVGSAIASSAQGSNKGVVYQVDMGANGLVEVVTDQTQIRSGDCVAVERAGETANLRRVTQAYCEPANARAIAAVAEESKEEAAECLAAKQSLVDASSMDEVELARVKVELLCSD